MTRQWTIRDFTPADYDGYTAVHNACYPTYLQAASDLARWDSLREPKIRWRRWVGEAGSTSSGCFSSSSWRRRRSRSYSASEIVGRSRT